MGFNVRTVLTNLFLWVALFGQAPDTLWTRTFGADYFDEGYSVQQTSDRGYIVTGRTGGGPNPYHLWLIKTDSLGDSLWTKKFGTVSMGYSVQQTMDGGFIITGIKALSNNSDPDVWLIKTDSNGDTLWTRTFGGSGFDWGNFVQQTSDSGFIITGYTYSFSVGSADVWLIKTDSIGDTLWTRTFGGSDWDNGRFVQQTLDGGYIIATETYSFGAGSNDAWLIKTDANGDSLWTRTVGGGGSDAAYSVRQNINGGWYILAGYTQSFGDINGDVFLAKVDENGNTLWIKTIGGDKSDGALSIQQTSDRGFFITGYTQSFGAGSGDVWLIKTDASGDTVWTKCIGGVDWDEGWAGRNTSDGGYVVTGFTESFGVFYRDLWLIKIALPVTAVKDPPHAIINEYLLKQNYPNPFNPTTTLEYAIASRQFVSLKVYDLFGKEVTILVDEEKPAGEYDVEFDASYLPSGIYFYQLRAGSYVKTKKMIVMK